MEDRSAGEPATAVPRILRIKTGFPQVVLFLGRYHGHLEHWQGHSFTFPCDLAGCRACKNGVRQDFYAYAPSQYFDASFRRWVPCTVQLTACAEEALRNKELRGTIWRLTRLPRKGTVVGKLVAQLVDQRPADQVPPWFCVMASLKVIFGDRPLKLDAPNNRITPDEQPEYLGAPPPGYESEDLPATDTSAIAKIRKAAGEKAVPRPTNGSAH